VFNNYLPDFEADIARLALFVQQIGGATAPPAPLPGTPMFLRSLNVETVADPA